jgi:phosphatidylglycerophosphate synthase
VKAWGVALALWLANRALDGLDGAIARARRPTARGAFLDIVADFSIYAGFVLGVAAAEPRARLMCVALLCTYYVSGSALLALSSLLERRGIRPSDGRSLQLLGGLAEGAETIIAYVLLCLLPGSARTIAGGFAVLVAVTALQRIAAGVRLLSADG